MKLIGHMEILRTRVYSLDPDVADSPEVVVKRGRYPLYQDGLSTFWLMRGKPNVIQRAVTNLGDGMFAVRYGDRASGAEVEFPSPRFGPQEWAELLEEPLFAEGSSAQRLRVHLSDAAVSS